MDTTFTARAMPSTPSPALSALDQLLRDRGEFLDALDEHASAATARAMIFAILGGTGLFGAALGLFHGGVQIFAAAVKLPLVLLFTAALATPALHAAARVADGAADLRRDLVLVLASLALTSFVLAALAPVVLLAVLSHASYHAVVLTVVACCGVAGALGLAFFLGGLSRQLTRGLPAVTALALTVFVLVGSQLAWTLRPYVVRPRAELALLRPMEGSFLDSVATTFRSARGVYHRDHAPLPGEE